MLSIKTMVMLYSIYKTIPYINSVYKYCNTVIYIFNVLISRRGYEKGYYEIRDDDYQYESVSISDSITLAKTRTRPNSLHHYTEEVPPFARQQDQFEYIPLTMSS